ncbi:MAG: J domain-containing protein [Synechococcus sp.]|nr:J domain-containing protein [Synechococcus sp.]
MPSRSTPPPSSPSASRKKLDRPAVQQRIAELLAAGPPDATALLAFAEFIHGKPFPEPLLTLSQLKSEVCRVFGCQTTKQLRQSSEFNLAMAGRSVNLKTKADWQKLYREWVGVPQAERNRSGATCIHGIDVLENFRPWHVFGLDPSTASADDIKEAFRRLAKEHHPDLGGDPRVMERLQKMRDSLLAFR